MAKKITSQDLFEGDIFATVRQSVEQTIDKIQVLNSELTESAKLMKSSAGGIKTDSSKGQKEFNKFTQEANQLKREKIELEKQEAQLQALLNKAKQEELKAAKAANTEAERQAKAQEKAVKQAQAESSAYAQSSKRLNELRKAYKDLALQNKENTAEAQKLLTEIQDLDTELKRVDATVGQHQRNVGNYGEATQNLKKELRELTKALQTMESTDPRFQEMAQRAGELKDTIADTQAIVKSTAGTAVENLGTGLAKTGKIGVDAFAGLTGAMGLFGVQSESAMQTMAKLQELAAVSEALNSLGALGDTMKEIQASFTAAAVKMGIFTTAKKADTVATNAQTTATGAATVATRLFGTAMNALPIVAIVSAVAALGVALYKYLNTANQLTQKQKDLNATFDDYKKGATDAITKTNEVKVAFDLARAGTISKKEALQTYNDTLGDTFGKASDLNEAERLYNEKTGAYIKATALRAQAQALLAMAAEEQVKAMTAGMEDQRSIAEEGAGVITDVLAGIIDYSTAGLTDLTEEADKAQAKLYKDAQKRAEKSAKDRSDSLVKLAESLLKEAGALEKNTGLTIKNEEAQKKQIKTTKDNTEAINAKRKAEEDEIALQERRAEEALARKRTEKEELDAIDLQIEKDAEARRLEEEKIDEQRQEYALEQKRKAEEDQLALEKEALQKSLAERNKWAETVANYFIEQSNRKIAQIDKEKAAAESQFDYLKQLAAQGNIDAKESLAEQQRIIDEANAKKERELKRQQRIKLAEAIYSTYNSKVAAGSENPLMETMRDAALLQQFIMSLPTFFDGTEDTGINGKGVDGKGGFHAILHPNERVIPKSLNDQIGQMSNEALTRLAMEYQAGKVVQSDSQIGSAYETAILASKIDQLNDTIRNKPETNIELGEITQSVMQIVKTSKKGHTTIYNRYRVRP